MTITENTQIKNSLGHIFCTISFDENSQILIDKWDSAFGSQDNFKNAIVQWLQMVKEQKVKKSLADLSNLVGSFDGSREWLITKVMPQAIMSGLVYQAIVLPKNIFASLSTKDYVTVANSLEIRQFGSVDDAKNWLDSVS